MVLKAFHLTGSAGPIRNSTRLLSLSSRRTRQ